MKNYIISAVIFTALLLGSMKTAAQDYTDTLDPVILSEKTTENVSLYSETNTYLIEKGTFRFKNEIKTAKKEQSFVYFDSDNPSEILRKTTYLKIVRRAGNRSDNATDFEIFLMNHIEALPKEKDLEALVKLYRVVRANTLEGKLDTIGSALTWL